MRENIQGLGWFVRRTDDVPLLTAFFRDVVGLPVLQENDAHVLFWAGETTAFEIAKGGKPLPQYTDRSQAPCVPIFRVHGIDETITRLKQAGVHFINDLPREHNHLAYFLDPKGNVNGLQERYRSSDRKEDAEAWRRWDAGETTAPGVPPLAKDLQHIGWVVFRSTDIPGQIAFYRDVIGLEHAVDYGESGSLMGLGDGTLLEISGGCPPQPMPTDRTEVNNAFVLRVHGLDGIVADLKAKGVHFVAEPFEIASGRLCYIADPEGHMLGLQERAADSPVPIDQEAARRWQNR